MMFMLLGQLFKRSSDKKLGRDCTLVSWAVNGLRLVVEPVTVQVKTWRVFSVVRGLVFCYWVAPYE